jgi:hypothetical protein
MQALAIDRQLSRSLMLGWAIPLVLLALPLFHFDLANRMWMGVAVAAVLAAIYFCRVAEVPPGGHARRDVAVPLPPPRQCRRAVYLFSSLAIAGASMMIIDKQGILGAFDIFNLQQRYIDMMVASLEGELVGSWMSTVGNVLRSMVYIAIVAMVALSRQTPGLARTGLPWMVLLVGILATEIATASRSYLVFCIVVGLVAGFAVGHRVIRRLGTLFLLGFVAVFLFSITTNQRLEATGADSELAIDVLTDLFDIHLESLGRWIADHLGFPVVTGLLYLSHPLPEFSRLVADGSSQVSLGAHSLYLVIDPVQRMLGAEGVVPPNALAQRPGMWWGMLGDLYLDFGIAFVVAYPALIAVMTRVAHSLRSPDVFSLAIRCLTGAMFFASPYFGVLNTYSFTYLLLLGLAAINLTLRRRSRPLDTSTTQPA